MATSEIKKVDEVVYPRPTVLSTDNDITRLDKNKAMCFLISIIRWWLCHR